MADNYGTVDGYKVYHTARGRNVVDHTDLAIGTGLLIGSEFIDGRYRLAFPGTKVGQRSQVRQWPRISAYDADGYVIPSSLVPTEVENATYEAAYRAIENDDGLMVDWSPAKYRRVSVDGAVSAEYMIFGSAMEAQRQFPAIDLALGPILSTSRNSSPLSGEVARV